MQGYSRHTISMSKSGLLLLAMLCSALAHAEPPAPVHIFPVLEDIGADTTFGVAARSDTLDAQRGGTDTVNNNMNLDGSVRDNVANNVVTGANSIDAGSFANMSGIPTVIQNSGANVLIQNATIINLQFK